MSILPQTETLYLNERCLSYEEVSEGAHRGLILRGFALPKGKFDRETADLLILLPPGFPDAPPDMFYLFPWVKCLAGNRYPRAADNPFPFGGRSWQRWSRHSNEWRAGRDGIATFLKRIEHAIDTAVA